MAAPSRTVPHPGRALLLLLVLIVAMLLGILGGKLFSPSQWQSQFKVGLGLDLSSGTQVTLQAHTLSGKPPSSGELNAADSVILSRVNGTGNSGAQVQPEGTNLLVVTVPGEGSKQTIQLVSQTALLMFRQVLLYQPYSATSTTPAAGASASPSTSASPSASTSPSAHASPTASASSTAKTSAKIVPAAAASASPSVSSSAKASASPTATASPSASSTATSSVSSCTKNSPALGTNTYGNPCLVTSKSVLALFNNPKLTCAPNDTNAWKTVAGYASTTPYNNAAVQVVACGTNGSGQWGKYLLDVSKVRARRSPRPPRRCPRPPTSGRST